MRKETFNFRDLGASYIRAFTVIVNTGEDISRSEEFVIAITMDQTIFSFETLITLCTAAMMTLHEEHLTNQLLLYIYKLPVLPFVHHSKIEQVKYIYGILFIIIWDLYRIYPFICTVCCPFQIVHSWQKRLLHPGMMCLFCDYFYFISPRGLRTGCLV